MQKASRWRDAIPATGRILQKISLVSTLSTVMIISPTPAHVEHFRLLYERHFGVALEREEARQTLVRLALLYLEVTRPDAHISSS